MLSTWSSGTYCVKTCHAKQKPKWAMCVISFWTEVRGSSHGFVNGVCVSVLTVISAAFEELSLLVPFLIRPRDAACDSDF